MTLKLSNNIKNEFVDETNFLPIIHKSIELGFNVGFRGPTGCGKTYLIQELAKQYKKKLWILNMTVDTEIEEIKGRLVPVNTNKGLQFKWINGVLVQAMINGDWIAIEESNFMNEEMASVFYSVMDHRRNIQLDEHENELIQAHKDFRLFLTMNWGYKGTIEPNDAIKNRVDAWFDLTYLSSEKEAKLIIERAKIDKEMANKIVSVANQFREREASENLPDISTRILIKWACLAREGIEPEIAAEHNIIPLLKYNELEKMKIREVIKTTFEKPEKILAVSRQQLTEVALRDGQICKVGDYIVFDTSDASGVKRKVKDIVRTTKLPGNPEGIKLVLEEGWMPPHKVNLHK